MKTVRIGRLAVGNDQPLTLIAGPCQLESLDHAQMIAGTLAEACAKAGMQFIFKASYDKANRTSLKGRRGLGMEEGLKILAAIREMGMPVLTDIHDEGQAREAAKTVDVIQIPVFLCRQTDLLVAAARTGRVITAAALLMSIVFAGIAASEVSFMRLFGVGLTLHTSGRAIGEERSA